MSNDSLTHGYASVQVGDGQPVTNKNYNPDDRLQQILYKNLVLGDTNWRNRVRPTSSTLYLRPGLLRYTKPNTLTVAAAPDANLWFAYNGGAYDQYYYPIGEYDFGTYYVDQRTSRIAFGAGYGTGEVPHSFASVSIVQWGNLSGVGNSPGGGPVMPTNRFPGMALTSVDIPGTSISNVFKHPADRTAWFNEVGIVALSQGNVEVRGPYSPSESLLQHMGHQVYTAKSGGTGRPGNPANAQLTAPIQGSGGSVSAPDTFVDGAAQSAFLPAFASTTALSSGTASSGASYALTDSTKSWTTNAFRTKLVKITGGTGAGQIRVVSSNTATSLRVSVDWSTPLDGTSTYSVIEPGNYYVRINSGAAKGTYLIVDYVDANTVKVDSAAINQPFGSESGLNWEVVTGPIGEYFWRKRSYFTYYYWGNGSYYFNGNQLSLGYLQHDVMPLQAYDGASPSRTIHDGGACWWALCNNGTVPLMRWVHASPQAFEPMHVAGKISGLSEWPYQNSYSNARDIGIDDQNKIWVVGDPVSVAGSIRNGRVSTLRIDPYPAGNAETPALDSSFKADVSGVATVTNPLGSNDIRAVVCDDSHAYVPNTRVWLLPGSASANNAISYTDSYGQPTPSSPTGWSRLHPLSSNLSGTVSVTAGTGDVVGTGTTFTSDFAVGDWVRFNGDSRSYKVTAIANDLGMTISPVHASGASGTYKRGAIPDLNRTCTRLLNVITSDVNALSVSKPPADYDTNGNLFWVSEDGNYVVKWNEALGTCTSIAKSVYSTPVGSAPEFESGGTFSLTVHRVPVPEGQADHPLNNHIWVGSRAQGMVLLKPVFDGSRVRYHRTLSNNWASGTMNMPETYNDPVMPVVTINPLTGAGVVYGKYRYFGNDAQFNYVIGMNDTRLGEFIGVGYPYTYQWDYWSSTSSVFCAEYDRVGLGMRAAIVPARQVNFDNDYRSGSLYGERWLCKRWDGSAWNYGLLNEINALVGFDPILAPTGPSLEFDTVLGSGLKRMHSDWQQLDADTKLEVRFVDTDLQAVAQEQQFLADENTTFICWVGQGKDNTQTANWSVDMYLQPTYTRFQTETNKVGRNIWTQDGGLDGGYSIDGNSSTSLLPPFTRGVSMPTDEAPRGGSPYPNFGNVRVNWGPYQNYTSVLRIKPELELTDGSIFGAVVGSSEKFTSASYTFTSADVGKSIIVEGVAGASPSPDNGQAVILSIESPTTVVTDKTFTTTASSLRWKLMDIPAVSYVVMAYEYAYGRWNTERVQYRLYSSSDRGVSWSEQKLADAIRNKPADTDLRLYQSDGVFFNNFNFLKHALNSDGNGYTSTCVFFDLKNTMSESARRRQYWKVRHYDVVQDSDTYSLPIGVFLLDDNFQPIGIPPNCRTDDSLDPDFQGTVPYDAKVVALSGSSVSAVDLGNLNGRTNSLTSTSSFYEQSGTSNAVLSGSNFSSSSAAFLPQDAGKYIRISGAPASANNGFAVITAYVNATTVTTDKAFTASTNDFSWQVLSFGPADSIRVLDANFKDPALPGVNLSDSTFAISDVPSNNQITLTANTFPASVSGQPFIIERSAGSADSVLGNNIGNNPVPTYDASLRWSYSAGFGALAWSQLHEFVTLQESGAATATAAADDDGDGRTDTLVIATALVAEAVAGDYIALTSSTSEHGRRVYEIASITPATPAPGQTTITVTYDEVIPSVTYSWQVLRRRDKTFSYPRLLVTTK